MDIKRLEVIAFSEGFVEDFLEQYIQEIDEETIGAKTFEQITQLKSAWGTLSNGLKDLRRENAALQAKIDAVRLAVT